MSSGALLTDSYPSALYDDPPTEDEQDRGSAVRAGERFVWKEGTGWVGLAKTGEFWEVDDADTARNAIFGPSDPFAKYDPLVLLDDQPTPSSTTLKTYSNIPPLPPSLPQVESISTSEDTPAESLEDDSAGARRRTSGVRGGRGKMRPGLGMGDVGGKIGGYGGGYTQPVGSGVYGGTPMNDEDETKQSRVDTCSQPPPSTQPQPSTPVSPERRAESYTPISAGAVGMAGQVVAVADTGYSSVTKSSGGFLDKVKHIFDHKHRARDLPPDNLLAVSVTPTFDDVREDPGLLFHIASYWPQEPVEEDGGWKVEVCVLMNVVLDLEGFPSMIGGLKTLREARWILSASAPGSTHTTVEPEILGEERSTITLHPITQTRQLDLVAKVGGLGFEVETPRAGWTKTETTWNYQILSLIGLPASKREDCVTWRWKVDSKDVEGTNFPSVYPIALHVTASYPSREEAVAGVGKIEIRLLGYELYFKKGVLAQRRVIKAEWKDGVRGKRKDGTLTRPTGRAGLGVALGVSGWEGVEGKGKVVVGESAAGGVGDAE